MLKEAVNTKLQILSSGVHLTEDFLAYYSGQENLIAKRRAYGTGDATLYAPDQKVPQEILLADNVICAVNSQVEALWKLDIDAIGAYVSDGTCRIPVTFPKMPKGYGIQLASGDRLEQVLTVYGDTTLGLFSPGHCYFFNDDRQCKFCSLGPAREGLADHRMKVTAAHANEALDKVCGLEPDRYKRVLVNGGNIRDFDKGFQIHLDLLSGLEDVVQRYNLERHLISMPPSDHRMFSSFPAAGDTLAMSLEIFDPELFAEICPGKDQDYGREQFLDAFDAAVEAIGRGNVYAGLVAGLEPVGSLIEAIYYFGERGVVPAIAVFHPDAGSTYADRQRPSPQDLHLIGRAMMDVYRTNGYRPLILGSGRNALDTEAYLGGF